MALMGGSALVTLINIIIPWKQSMNLKLHVCVLVLVGHWIIITQIKCSVMVMPCIEHGCTNDQLTYFEYMKSICINCLLSMERKHIHRYKYISKILKIIVGRFSCNH